MTAKFCVWYSYDSDIWMDYPKLISEKWNLTAKFNCLEAIYFYAPSALAVPMCDNYKKV